MALATNKKSDVQNPNLALVRQVTAAAEIFEGAICSLDASSDAVVAVSTTKCGGIAQNYAAIGDRVTLHFNHVERLTLATTVANVGVAVYATSDNVLTLSANTCIVGYIVDRYDAAEVWVHVVPSYPYATS